MSETAITRTSRVAILVKGSLYGVIALDIGLVSPDGHCYVVGSNDPRANPSTYHKSFETAADAQQHFDEALATSRDRGWTVAHVGPRHIGL